MEDKSIGTSYTSLLSRMKKATAFKECTKQDKEGVKQVKENKKQLVTEEEISSTETLVYVVKKSMRNEHGGELGLGSSNSILDGRIFQLKLKIAQYQEDTEKSSRRKNSADPFRKNSRIAVCVRWICLQTGEDKKLSRPILINFLQLCWKELQGGQG